MTDVLIPTWTVGDRLHKALDSAGVSVQEMADHLVVSRTTVSNYIHGRTTPTRSTLRDWALRTGVPLHWIITGQAPQDLTDTGTVTQRYPRRRTSDLLPAGLPFAADTGAVTRPVAA